MKSPRLAYRRLDRAQVDTFHRLATDEHIRRYLMDGEIVDRAWAEAEAEQSDALFARLGVGLWIAHAEEKPIGFVGFRVFEELGPDAQLLYAFLEPHTGQGYATEAARALLEEAAGWSRVVSAVDAPNQASIRVLEKVGFVETGRAPLAGRSGAFGDIVLYAFS